MALNPMRSDPKHLFILAGEPSGDRIGAALLHDLKDRTELALSGVGGHFMAEEGLNSLYPMQDLSVMGFSDVFRRLPLLLWRLRQTARAILKAQPDAVVLIDSQVFCAVLAKRLRKAGYQKPILLYVAPAVWAWKPERAPAFKALYDEILAVLPIEPAVMKKLGGPETHYVGHPALAATPWLPEQKAPGLVGLLPGSRDGELNRHLPLLRSTVDKLAKHPSVSGFVMPTLPHLEVRLRNETRDWPAEVKIVVSKQERDAAIAQMHLAIVTAGTITLELALAGVPMIGTYVPDKRLLKHYEKAGRPLVALPNVLMNNRIVPEIVPGPDHADRLYNATLDLLNDPQQRKAQRDAFLSLREMMDKGTPDAPKENATDRVLASLD